MWKILCEFEPQSWLEIITSRDAKSACFQGSQTSCTEIYFLAFFCQNLAEKDHITWWMRPAESCCRKTHIGFAQHERRGKAPWILTVESKIAKLDPDHRVFHFRRVGGPSKVFISCQSAVPKTSFHWWFGAAPGAFTLATPLNLIC